MLLTFIYFLQFSMNNGCKVSPWILLYTYEAIATIISQCSADMKADLFTVNAEGEDL